MPLGPGSLDSNGIWQYGEDDSEDLFSDLLNVGQESTSDAIALDRARIGELEGKFTPGGWTTISTGLVYKLFGGVLVEIRTDSAGIAQSLPVGNTTLISAGIVPSIIRPTTRTVRGAAYLAGFMGGVAISTSGDIVITNQTGATRASAGFSVLYFLG
jgi:hypothetical protein